MSNHNLNVLPADSGPFTNSKSECLSRRQARLEFTCPEWQWPVDVDTEPESSSSHFRSFSNPPVKPISPRSQPLFLPGSHAITTQLPRLDSHHSCVVHQGFQQSDSTCHSPLSPLSFADLVPHNPRFRSDCERSSLVKCSDHLSDDEEILSPLDWNSKRNSLPASPFSSDSESDDGLSPSPFSSPESSQADEDDDNAHFHRSDYFPSSPTLHVYHDLDQYPPFRLYHDQTHDDGDLSPLTGSPSSLPSSIGLDLCHDQSANSSNCTLLAFGLSELGLQSPSLLSTPLPSLSPYDDFLSIIPCSPHHRALDLPLETETDGLRLPQSSYLPSYAPGGQGVSQRSTWLSLPGADTDDDLIRADLASKNYIPDPSLAIPTTPPSRSLLIWDPSTRSGLPANLPSFDGAVQMNKLDAGDLLLGRPPSPDEDVDIDPILLAELVGKDTEKWAEIQKLCELKQRTTMAAAMASSKSWRDREGMQIEAERVKERWREVTALLRLKLKLDEKKVKDSDVDCSEEGSNASMKDDDKFGGPWPPSTDSFDPSSVLLSSGSKLASYGLSSTPDDSISVPASTSTPMTPSNLPPNLSTSGSSPAARIIQRRTSKPKITSMDQLVANMVLHRQQDIRRSPVRGRTWPLVPSSTDTAVPTRKKSWIQTSPTSPLRQMTLPEDLDGDKAGAIEKDASDDSPLQLSPLCLTLCGSPESFYTQLEFPRTSLLSDLQPLSLARR